MENNYAVFGKNDEGDLYQESVWFPSFDNAKAYYDKQHPFHPFNQILKKVDPTEVVSEEPVEVEPPRIKLTAYEWSVVLKELEHNLRVVNRDTSQCEFIWNKITEQMNEIVI